MKKKQFTALILALSLSLIACGNNGISNSELSETVSETVSDADFPSEATSVSQGEYQISDITFSSDYVTDDNNRIFYEIFTGSFSDSDGDGIGDLQGIISRLDYLNDGDPTSGRSLGIEGIWLTPVFTSDSYHKYNVDDYYSIDPSFGTMEDLQELITDCHARGIKLILDLPINHTGNNNAWFTAFLEAHQSGDPDNEYYDFYSWYDADRQEPAGELIYHQIEGTNHFYECNFDTSMPELNFENEKVRQAVYDIAAYYLDMGIDGFRFDAAKYIYLDDTQASVDFWLWYIDELRQINPDIYTVAEVWDADAITDAYYPALNCFCFTTSQEEGAIAKAAKGGNVNTYTSYVESYTNRVKTLREDASLVSFLANHDTDRSAGYLSVSSDDARMAANLYLLNTGSSFIYYGEEIGMKGSRGGADTDANRRLAMLWGDEDSIRDPDGSTYEVSKQINGTVTDQLAEADSLLNYYKRLIMIRQANPEIARGEYEALTITDSKAGGFLCTWQGNSVCVIHNTTDEAASIDLKAALADTSNPDLLLSSVSVAIGVEGTASLDNMILTLGARTSAVLR